MISKPKVGSLLSLLLLVAMPAAAEVRNYQLVQQNGTFRCDAATGDPAAEPNRIVVNVAAGAGASLSGWQLAYTKAGAAAMEPFNTATPISAAVNLADVTSGTSLGARGTVSGNNVSCGDFLPTSANGGGTRDAAAASPADTSYDQAARIWFASAAGKTAAETLTLQLESRLATKRIRLLPHLPSGAIASPYPASMSERDSLQIVLIIHPDEARLRGAQITMVSCPERDSFRILGSLSEVIGTPQGRTTPRTIPTTGYVLMPVAQVLQCGAGTVSYALQISLDGKPSGDPVQPQVTLRPIYQLAATGAWGFDTADIPAYSVVDGKVVEARSRLGSQLYFGFVWYPTGIDYEDVTGVNRFAPFLFFDPASIKEHFVVGAALTAKGRISIPIGISVHKVPVLKGTAVGSAFTGDGDVPTTPNWTKKGIGLYVGVAFNIAEFLRVKAAVTPPAK